MRRPGKILPRPGAAPLRRLRRHLPLQGRLLRGRPPRKAPLQGELDAPEGADGGVHCRLAVEMPHKVRQGLALAFRRVCGGREDAATRKDICRARCGTPPPPAATPPLAGEAFEGAAVQKGSPARGAGCAGRRRLRGALPAGGGNIPQGSAGPCPAFCGRCGGRESTAARKGICRARCGTPPSPAATPPLTGEAFEGAAARCSRFCGPCALCCRAGVHARRGGVRRRGHGRLMQNAIPQSL